MVDFWTSFWLVMSDVSTPCSGVCSLARNGGSTSRLQWQCVSKKPNNIPFMMKAVKISLADCHMVVLVLSCELFWNPSCRNFMRANSVVVDLICRTMTDVQMLCHFVNSRPSVIQNRGADSFNVSFCCGCGWVSGSFIKSETCATVFEHGNPIIHTPLR